MLAASPPDSGPTRNAPRGAADAPADGRRPAVPPIAPPSLSFPKGGGAARGLGEKFTANPVTGTGSLSVPIPTSPGRSGFGPQLSLTYDSGAGGGVFGLGWSLSLPSITRKTEKGLPRYRDSEDSDVFLLSGVEDLVPEVDDAGKLQERERTVSGVAYLVRRYRPRIEGLFGRIERWTERTTGESHWRSITRDNITSVYGSDPESRIFDPDDPNPEHPTRVFSWLLCRTYDDRGNVVHYRYAAETDENVDLDASHERNRAQRGANRYPRRILYGNRTPFSPDLSPHGPATPLPPAEDWLFEVVFDYGEHDADRPRPDDAGPRPCRPDPFSSYRAGFELRTYRLCRRVLMFHHFPNEAEVGRDCLVRSTDFTYRERSPADLVPEAAMIVAVTQSGYRRLRGGGYLRRSLPPLELEYSRAAVSEEIRDVDASSLEGLPAGADGAQYHWVDLDGEGLSGLITEQGGGWFYKRNVSVAPEARFAPIERVAAMPSVADLDRDARQWLDLEGDGRLDLVHFDGPLPGFSARTEDGSWERFTPFQELPTVPWRHPSVRFVDLTGDGFADLLITEEDALVWHPSHGQAGFGGPERVCPPLDEERGPRLVATDGAQSLYLADLSGDGLADLVRIRNGEVCYWPNLGYGRFGARVAMDDSPWFDTPDQFDHRRLRLADVDGSGVTDLVYLGRDSVRIYFNDAGNRWSPGVPLASVPVPDNLSAVAVTDLLGNGTACLVWSSPLPADAGRSMRYVDLMGGQKPHLLVRVDNNLGAETRLQYAPSTRFYLQDRAEGRPWITRLPFPVHVVERVETWDHIGRSRFVTRYAYHHGFFDGVEREFRGFGMVEQWDTEVLAALTAGGDLLPPGNLDAASHVPPVLTRTWFHTGAYLGRDHVSGYFAGLLNDQDRGEYFREPGRQDDAATRTGGLLLADTVLPPGLTVEEEREACRALKGVMLRQEVYGLDGTPKEPLPYTVTEQNFTIEVLQRRGNRPHAVFFTHAREAVACHYERSPDDPRIAHTLTLAVDPFGAVLRSLAVAYPRRERAGNHPEQGETHVLLTLNRWANRDEAPDWRRIAMPVEARTYEVVKPPTAPGLLRWEDVRDLVNALAGVLPAGAGWVEPPADRTVPVEQWDWRRRWVPGAEPGGALNSRLQLIEHVRTLYRPDDLGTSRGSPTALLPLAQLESLALPGETYGLCLTPGLVTAVFGARVDGALLETEGRYVQAGGDGNWWVPSGRTFLSPDPRHSAGQELEYARRHFFLPCRYRDPFHGPAANTEAVVTYDRYDLLPVDTRDAVGNRVSVGERDPGGALSAGGNDYRVLHPRLLTDPNGNRAAVAFDALGMVAGTAVMGKAPPAPPQGDSLETFEPDLTSDQTDAFYGSADPAGAAPALLKGASTRVVYDLDRFMRTRAERPEDPAVWEPVYAAVLSRETHAPPPHRPDGAQHPAPADVPRVQVHFVYSDGLGHEIQSKVPAEPGPLVEGGPPVTGRWAATGWTLLNNKGLPVRKYEPFFSRLPERRHRFEWGVRVGVSATLFYDPPGRVVGTLHPDHSWEKIVFDPWKQVTWDANDTTGLDPREDADLRGFLLYPDGTERLPSVDYVPTWHALRTDPAHATLAQERWPDARDREAEARAAEKAALHTRTPAEAHFDSLGRTFLTLAHAGFKADGSPIQLPGRVVLDVEGNEREVRDADTQGDDPRGRVVMQYGYDLLGSRIHQQSMEAGARWALADVAGNPIRGWDSRGHAFRTGYDLLRRPLRSWVRGIEPAGPAAEVMVERVVYGEQHPEAAARNLRGVPFLHLDPAGAALSEECDFKGNLIRTSRRCARAYRSVPDWAAADAALPADATAVLDPARLEGPLSGLLEPETFTSMTRYDALNRPVQVVAPYSDRPGAKVSVIQPTHNEANLLEQVHVWLQVGSAPAELLDPATAADGVGVRNIDYDAHARRTRIEYKNRVETGYDYDPETFRLRRIFTTRGAAFPDDCPQPAPGGWPGCSVQSLRYTYDPVGNITAIRDDAQQRVFFRNRRVEPSADYTYDPLYRLVRATGREHLGQVAGQPGPPTPWGPDDSFHCRQIHPGDGAALGTYVEEYLYDASGNLQSLRHQGDSPQHPVWTRSFAYREASQIEDGAAGRPRKSSNRLSSSTLAGRSPGVHPHTYDAHGNMTAMSHLPLMRWDHRDQLQVTAQQVVGHGVPATTWYAYDAAGQRVRKVTDHEAEEGQEPRRRSERIYLGGIEIYREYGGDGVSVTLERETLHVMDDAQRIALVETRTVGDEPQVPEQLVRYQLGNHLGSASLELDEGARIVSYEEYSPYGSTSYQGVRSQTEAPKRYRFTGKERDEESGFYYHGARYYAPWLARWASCDSTGLDDGTNLYLYAHASPTRYSDPSGHMGFESQLWLAEQLTQDVRATRSGRGFDRQLNRDMTKASEAFGPGGKTDVGHLDKPQALTQSGEVVRTGPQSSGPNRSAGATIDKAQVAQARAAGEFTREKGVDFKAPKSMPRPRPPKASWRAKLSQWTAPKKAATPPAAAPPPAAPAPQQPSGQIELFPKASGPTGAPNAALPKATGAGGSPPANATPTPEVKPAAPVTPHMEAKAPPASGVPHETGVPKAEPKPSTAGKVGGVVGMFSKLLMIVGIVSELDALEKGQDINPHGKVQEVPMGTVITDFNKLPEGFQGNASSTQWGTGFYEKKNGAIYVDGERKGHGGC